MWEYNYDELYHHGVKGMKWGVRKAAKYTRAAGKAKRAADEFDLKAKEAGAQGRYVREARYKEKAANKRKYADEYEKRAKRLTKDTTYRDLEYYKHNQRVKKVVGGFLGTTAAAATVAVLPTATIALGMAALSGYSI